MPIPLTNRSSGYFSGCRDANVQIELFVDIQCPYSAMIWPIILQVLDKYGAQIGLSTHFLTLSNHRQSWDVTKAIFGVAQSDHGYAFKFITHLFAAQPRFYNGEFADKTHNDLLKLVGELSYEFDGTGQGTMRDLLDNDDTFAMAKVPGRYAALRGVWSTPTIFINDAEQMELGSSSLLEDWQAVIDPLLT